MSKKVDRDRDIASNALREAAFVLTELNIDPSAWIDALISEAVFSFVVRVRRPVDLEDTRAALHRSVDEYFRISVAACKKGEQIAKKRARTR